MRYPDCLVFDIGGTTFRAGVFTSSQRLVKPVLRRPSPSFVSQPGTSTSVLQEQLLASIVEAAELLKSAHPRRNLKYIGIAVPGPTDSSGKILTAPPLWGKVKRPYPLRTLVEERLKMNCEVVNDITAAAARYGFSPLFRQHRWICVVTVSTGVGNKVFDTKTGEALLDPRGISGEIGHVTVDLNPRAAVCDCGQRGHLSAIASGRGTVRFAQRWARSHLKDFKNSHIARWTGNRPGKIDGRHLSKGAKAGDRFALAVLDQVTLPMAQALGVLVGSVGVEKIIFVGGFALGVGKPYLRALQNNLVRVGMFGRNSRDIMSLVCLGHKDDDSGLIGAGLLVQRKKK